MIDIRPILIAIALSLAIVAPASGQNLDRGIKLFQKGEHSTAFSLLMLLVEQRNAAASYLIGVMYESGMGVPRSQNEAQRFYRLAAELGSSRAAHSIGVLYEFGHGVPKDKVEAYAWYRLSTDQMPVIRQLRDIYDPNENFDPRPDMESLELRMNSAERQKSEGLYAELRKNRVLPWQPKPPIESERASSKSTVDDPKLVLIGAGSSFMISKNGHLLTNQHVVDGCQIVTVHPPSGLKKALVVATDDTNDLALLKTDLEDDNVIPISGTNVSLLEDVVVAGYPLSGSLSTTVKVTKGVVSSLAGLGNDYSHIQIDAAIQPGNSGGPILNDQGNVVAVTVAALNKEYFLKEQGTIPENTNFGIKSSTARAFVDANGVKLPQPYSRAMSRRDMADLITKTTHLVGCWVSRATAQKMASDQKQDLSVSPTMQRQVDALR